MFLFGGRAVFQPPQYLFGILTAGQDTGRRLFRRVFSSARRGDQTLVSAENPCLSPINTLVTLGNSDGNYLIASLGAQARSPCRSFASDSCFRFSSFLSPADLCEAPATVKPSKGACQLRLVAHWQQLFAVFLGCWEEVGHAHRRCLYVLPMESSTCPRFSAQVLDARGGLGGRKAGRHGRLREAAGGFRGDCEPGPRF